MKLDLLMVDDYSANDIQVVYEKKNLFKNSKICQTFLSHFTFFPIQSVDR